ncbi:MAG: HDOD domain-containing protein, partial [Gammaproteobacteria bacterium]
RVNDPEVGLPELAEIISRDAALSIKTLRYVNSPAVGLRAQVESVQQALTLLGLDTIRHWVTVLSIAGMDFGDNAPELFLVMLTRARFCELVSKEAGFDKPGTYFTIGLLSGIDVLMNADMERIIGELPLTDEVKAALIRHEGTGGDILRTAMALEQGLMNEIMFNEVDAETLNRCWLEALEWADEVNRVSDQG